MKYFLIIIANIFSFHLLYSQADAKSQAIKEIERAKTLYAEADHLSFDVRYRYSQESEPDVFLDSLTGRICMNKNSFWSSIDSTETIKREDLAITLFKEDKIMMLSSQKDQAKTQNPFSSLDSLSKTLDAVKVTLGETDQFKIITLLFPKEFNCKKMEYQINKSTGFIEKAISYVKSEQLYDPSVSDLIASSGSFSIIEINYNNYKLKSFDDSLLSPENYFTRNGNQFSVTPAFENYKLYLSNSNF